MLLNLALKLSKAPFCQNSNFVRRVINCAKIPGIRFRLASSLWSDNQSSITIALNPVLHNTTEHIAIKHQYLNASIQNGGVVIKFFRSKDNFAAMVTKQTGPRNHESSKENQGC